MRPQPSQRPPQSRDPRGQPLRGERRPTRPERPAEARTIEPRPAEPVYIAPPPVPGIPEVREVREVPEVPERTELPYGKRVYLPMAEDAAPVDAYAAPEFPEYRWPDGAWLLNVAQVRTADAARAIPCDVGTLSLRKGDSVVLEVDGGVGLAVLVSAPRRQLVEGRGPARVVRKAQESDLRAEARSRLLEAEALATASEIVRSMGLQAKVVRAETSLQGGRTVIFLASEDRVELRDLARRLATAFRGRVDIRHIGVRDAARSIGGVGPCGLQLCCNTFLADFAPVSIRQAKDQGLALNPQRVSGVCGRLMCCLVYEDAFYRQQRALFPKQGKRVITPQGEGRVREVDVLARTVRVVFPDNTSESFTVDDVRPAATLQQGGAQGGTGGQGTEGPQGPDADGGTDAAEGDAAVDNPG